MSSVIEVIITNLNDELLRNGHVETVALPDNYKSFKDIDVVKMIFMQYDTIMNAPDVPELDDRQQCRFDQLYCEDCDD